MDNMSQHVDAIVGYDDGSEDSSLFDFVKILWKFKPNNSLKMEDPTIPLCPVRNILSFIVIIENLEKFVSLLF